MVLAILLSLILLMWLDKLKHLAIGFLPLILVQNEMWLTGGPGVVLSSWTMVLNVSWLLLFGQLVGRRWPSWAAQSSAVLQRLKG